MIEKIMRAVKSSNKKRGRNITIGTVLGMLLSCTTVIRADDYLWIRNNNGRIEYNTAITSDTSGTGGNWTGNNPYPNNSWDGNTYINNITLSGNNNGVNVLGANIGYGLKLSGDLGRLSFINNSLISGIAQSGGYGIYNENGNIGSLQNIGAISGSRIGIYNRSYGSGTKSVIKSLQNIGIISEGRTGIYNYSLDSGTKSVIENLQNIGSISGSNYGIENYSLDSGSSVIESLQNIGIISGSSGIYNFSRDSGSSVIESLQNIGIISGGDYGIYNYSSGSSSIENVINRGSISGGYYGIYNFSSNSSEITSLINSGNISGGSYGILNESDSSSTSEITSLINRGSISGGSSGIDNYSYGSGTSVIKSLINIGVIHGKTDTIKNIKGTINSLNNYGILITDGSTIISNSGTISTQNNYGLQIKNGGASAEDITAGNPGNSPIDIIIGYDVDGKPLTREMTIKNDKYFLNFSNFILNALENTYEFSSAGDKLNINGSIINAYGTAIYFGASGENELTLSGTIVNGGIKDSTYAIKGIDGSSVTLILEGAEVEYKDIDNRFQQTIINGDIHMGSGDNNITLKNGSVVNGSITTGTGTDTLTIYKGAQINGTLTGEVGGESNILNFKTTSTTKTASASDDEIRIMHNISGFENINVGTNVTFYEKTVNTSGAMVGLEITGVESLTIGANGALTLRIDTTNGANTHALSTGNTGGTIYSENGGRLLLALNGAGNNSIISFGGTALDGSLVTQDKAGSKESITLDTTSKFHTIERVENTADEVRVVIRWNLPDYLKYTQLNKIYQSIVSVNDLISNFNVDDDEKLSLFLSYLNDIYAGNPYSYSSELSRKSAGMFRDIVTENQFKPNLNNWLIYGGLTHTDGGTKDTYYGKGYYTYDIGSSNIDADTKITGAYMLGEYGVSDTLTSGVIIGGNKLKSNISNGSKVDGAALYLGAYAKKYLGNLKVTAGAGFQYGDYDADRLGVNKVASVSEKSVIKYSDNYNDITYDIYLNGRYSNPIGENLFLEPYGTLSYTYIKQDGANEGSKTLAIETDSKSFDYTVGKIGLDLKKNIPHSNGKSTLTAGVSYTKILDGAEKEYITGRFKGGSNFDILVAHKNQHSIGLNAKYALELESGLLFDVKGTYSVERDSHNNSGKNRTKGEWIVGTGLGYKF